MKVLQNGNQIETKTNNFKFSQINIIINKMIMKVIHMMKKKIVIQAIRNFMDRENLVLK
jgi:hypothetical protein